MYGGRIACSKVTQGRRGDEHLGAERLSPRDCRRSQRYFSIAPNPSVQAGHAPLGDACDPHFGYSQGDSDDESLPIRSPTAAPDRDQGTTRRSLSGCRRSSLNNFAFFVSGKPTVSIRCIALASPSKYSQT